MVVTKVSEHVRVHRRDAHAGGVNQPVEAAGGSVPVHPPAASVEQDRPASPVGDRAVNRPADGGWQRDQDGLGALSAHA